MPVPMEGVPIPQPRPTTRDAEQEPDQQAQPDQNGDVPLPRSRPEAADKRSETMPPQFAALNRTAQQGTCSDMLNSLYGDRDDQPTTAKLGN